MPPKILLADDSITIQKIVHQTFENQPIELISVGNGEAAVRKAMEIHPQLVLADIFMPGKNGYEVCDFIKQQSDLTAIPVILLVGAFEPFDEKEAARVHADDHLKKPFDPQMLLRAVHKFVEFEARPLTKRRAVSQPEGRSEPKGTAGGDETKRAFARTEKMTSPLDQHLVHTPPPAMAEAGSLPSTTMRGNVQPPVESDAALQPPSQEMPLEISHITDEPSVESPEQAVPRLHAPEESGELLEGIYIPPVEAAETRVPPVVGLDVKTVDDRDRTEKMEVPGWGKPPVPTADEKTERPTRSGESEVFGPRYDSVAAEEEVRESISVSPVIQSTSPAPAPIGSEITQRIDNVAAPRSVSGEESHIPATMEELMGEKTIPIPGGEIEELSSVPSPPDSERSAASSETPLLSEEVLDRIARRVVERMSSRVVEEVAWEVVPEIAESILRKNLSKNK